MTKNAGLLEYLHQLSNAITILIALCWLADDASSYIFYNSLSGWQVRHYHPGVWVVCDPQW